jgi:hypothetical protein
VFKTKQKKLSIKSSKSIKSEKTSIEKIEIDHSADLKAS